MSGYKPQPPHSRPDWLESRVTSKYQTFVLYLLGRDQCGIVYVSVCSTRRANVDWCTSPLLGAMVEVLAHLCFVSLFVGREVQLADAL